MLSAWILGFVSKDHFNVSGILDWEYAMSGSPLMDIGNILKYGDLRNHDFLFISSYKVNDGLLPAKWVHKAKLLDLIALCGLLNRKECGEVRVRDIKRLIKNTMDNWDTYDTMEKSFMGKD